MGLANLSVPPRIVLPSERIYEATSIGRNPPRRGVVGESGRLLLPSGVLRAGPISEQTPDAGIRALHLVAVATQRLKIAEVGRVAAESQRNDVIHMCLVRDVSMCVAHRSTTRATAMTVTHEHGASDDAPRLIVPVRSSAVHASPVGW